MWPLVHKWWLVLLVFPGDRRGWESAGGRGEGGQHGEAEESGRRGQRKGMQSAWNYMFQSWMHAETTLTHLWHPSC